MKRPLRIQSLEGRRMLAGQSEMDLVGFARALKESGVELYGAAWSPAVTGQRALFEDGNRELPFIEVTNPDRSPGQIANDEAITAYPTWVRPSDDERLIGIQSLTALAEFANIEIPVGDAPSFAEVGDLVVRKESPLHVPIDAYDPNGGPLTVSITIENPDLLSARVLEGNRSLRVQMNDYGEMVFELFEQRAPTATGRLIELAEDGFYDDILFHRIIDNFVIQGGDPTGTGTSGSSLPNFDDDFHPELQHNRPGVLSWAKSSDDTNNSQFFITEVATRFLDFNHSVAGQLVEGELVREAISEHSVNARDFPTTDVSIHTIEVVEDQENSVILFEASGQATGSTRVTITVTDQDGNSTEETILVDVEEDVANSQPFLKPLVDPVGPAGQPLSLQLESIDVEGDAVMYLASSADQRVSVTLSETGLVTVTPNGTFSDDVEVSVTVRPGVGVTGNSRSDADSQIVHFQFGEGGGGPVDPPEPPDPLAKPVEIKVITTDLAGNEISTINTGESFLVELQAIDLRNGFDRDGVFSAFADIEFDPGLVRPAENPITHLDGFQLASNGIVRIDEIDELGGASQRVTASNQQTSSIATIRMIAFAPGVPSFVVNPADEFASEVLLFGLDNEIPSANILYTSTSIEIQAPWHRASNPEDVNGDGLVAPSDALATINLLTTMEGSFAVHDRGTQRFIADYRYDTNGDGWITPSDIVKIINVLNRDSQSTLEAEPFVVVSDFLPTENEPNASLRMER
ncbi:MAG: peptidylprolyl isomerase [Planctomycetota bacterium]